MRLAVQVWSLRSVVSRLPNGSELPVSISIWHFLSLGRQVDQVGAVLPGSALICS
uniref:Uncharacterized protein n=1 Tax=Utricularia reniformis TaxID=192314 RepID=A0A1Y0B3D5_9LAMI|nr:hypothetical protein AEK19_MT1792 [Utricularia reniformis]ART31965.1 hypothetical protein AEK19_MT1792 [Utricularia reniformis]